MYYVKIVNRQDPHDIVMNRGFDNEKDALKYYTSIKVSAEDKYKIIRPANEELQQVELRYCDIILYLMEDDNVISKFMVG